MINMGQWPESIEEAVNYLNRPKRDATFQKLASEYILAEARKR